MQGSIVKSVEKEKRQKGPLNILQIKNELIQNNRKYFQSKVNQNKVVIDKYCQLSGKTQYEKGILALRQLSSQINSNLHCFQPEICDFSKMIRTKIENSISQIKQQQNEFYRTTIKNNELLMKQGQCVSSKFFGKEILTIQKLFQLDVLSIFLRQNYLFRKYFKNTSKRLFLIEQIKQFINISHDQFRRYQQAYSNMHHLLCYEHCQQVDELITILALIKMKSRISHFLRLSFKKISQVITNYHLNLEYKQLQTQELQYSQEIIRKYKLNFCQICFISSFNEKEAVNIQLKDQINKELQILAQSNCRVARKHQFLLIKIKYNLSFKAIIKFIDSFQTKDQARKQSLFYQQENPYIYKLKSFLKFAFSKHKTLEQALSAFQLRKKFGIEPLISQIKQKKPYIIDLIAQNLIDYYKLLQYVSSKQLSLQASLRPAIVVKRYHFSYQQIKNEPTNKQDLVLTLILATHKSNVLFFYIFYGKLGLVNYLRLIKVGIQKSGISYPFFTVVGDYSYNKTFSWRHYIRFASTMNCRFDSRVYFINQSQFCKLNNLLYVSLHHYLRRLTNKIQKDNFYECASSQIVSKLLLFNERQKTK